MPVRVRMTAQDMNRALYWHFAGKWAVLTEVTARAKYAPPPAEPEPEPAADPGALFARPRRPYVLPVCVSSHRRIDVLLLRTSTRVVGGVERLAIEVKVDRQDFLNDVRDPDKQAPWRALAHRHTYAVPEGLVAVGEVPGDSGLLVVRQESSGSTVTWARRAVKPAGHNPGPLPLENLMDAFYRASRAEARIKGHDARRGDVVDDPDEMRAELARLNKQVARLTGELERKGDQADRWKQAFAAHGCPPCGTCGKPLHLARRSRRGYGVEWEHRGDGDEDMCQLLRVAAAHQANNELPEGRRIDHDYVYVPLPEPGDVDGGDGAG